MRNHKVIFTILSVAAVLALTFSTLGTAPARAAGIVVNGNADDTLANLALNSTCDLREAITAANTDSAVGQCPAGSGADTITFAANYTITLVGSQLPAVTGVVTITGNGASNTIVQASTCDPTVGFGGGCGINYRVFEVTSTGNLTLNDISVKHGQPSFSNGSGIYNAGTLTVNAGYIADNFSDHANGGGIYNGVNATATLNDTIIHSNLSAENSGTGIHNDGTMTLTRSVISSNVMTSGASGGGITNGSTGTLTVSDSAFTDNDGDLSGGAILNYGALTVTNSTFSGNFTSSGTLGEGGAIYNGGGAATITNSTFSGNSSSGIGGAITNDNGATLTISDSTFDLNIASASGGGIANTTASSLTVTDSVLSNNRSSSSANGGGGIYNDTTSTTVITNTTISGNQASYYGGGIYNANILNVTGSTFSENRTQGGTVTQGGGIYSASGTATIINSTFSANRAYSTSTGGGIHNDTGTLTLTNVTLTGNISSSNGESIRNDSGTLNYTNTIIVQGYSAFVTDCSSAVGAIGANSNNLVEDNSCSPSLSGDPMLDTLADNGGLTQTHALLAGSPAIDAGAGCPATDQRGVARPQGAACDIGAYEYGPVIPVVTASNPSANAVLTSLTSINVTFNQDMLDNATADGAENVNNYLLVEQGANSTFDTIDCAGGSTGDDALQTISAASYNNAGGVYISTITLANPLTTGTYRLFVCGTTSIWSVAGLELNNGVSDYTTDFTITGTGTGGTIRTETTAASSLPKTGFAPNKITTLPAQPATLEYAKLGDIWLEIPSLNVKSTIVGVTQNKDNSWDVSWLGNDTGWLNGTAFPTWNGNSVLTAHVTNPSGLDGPFAALKSLKYGDQVIVHFGGVKYVYEVRNTRLMRPYSTNFAFESKQDHSYLTLITCSGYNPINESYLLRRVVRAVLVSTISE
ncbi:MAG: sortase [Chloroflexi bacterium]|nr:sortase [Chloroflexota bacterium]